MEERFVIMYLCHQFSQKCPWFSGEDDSVAPGLRDLVSLIVVQQGLCISLLSFAGYALTAAPWHFGSLQTLSDFSHFFIVSQWPQQVHSFSPTGEKVREC